MSKPYSFVYHFSGTATSAGTMICVCCNKEINSFEHDWLEYKKDTKGDWGYRTKHRSCTENQRGWEDLERKSENFERDVEDAMKVLNKFKDKGGEYSNVLYEALNRLNLDN